MRSRILTLPLMGAAVLMILWRQVPSVHELTRMLVREDLLWCKAVKVAQQSVSERFLGFPVELFERVHKELLPEFRERSEQRRARPLPPSIVATRTHFAHIWVADGSTLEALFRKLDSLQEGVASQLAGKMCLVIDLVRQLPIELWFSEESRAFDTNFIDPLLALVRAKTLLILDRGFYDFTFFAQLMDKGAHFITRLKSNAKLEVVRRLTTPDAVCDLLVRLGTGQNGAPTLTHAILPDSPAIDAGNPATRAAPMTSADCRGQWMVIIMAPLSATSGPMSCKGDRIDI